MTEYHPEWDTTSPGPSGIDPVPDEILQRLTQKAISYEVNESTFTSVTDVYYLECINNPQHFCHVVIGKDHTVFLPWWKRWYFLTMNRYGVVTKQRLRGTTKRSVLDSIEYGPDKWKG